VFNFYFSTARVKIEHVNGWLKNRFASLRGIRTQIKLAFDFKLVNQHILVCLILHNILLTLKDEQFEDDDSDDESEDDIEAEAAAEQERAVLRDSLQQVKQLVHSNLFDWINERIGDV
jgi:nitrogen fixation-related uncharacterized protein